MPNAGFNVSCNVGEEQLPPGVAGCSTTATARALRQIQAGEVISTTYLNLEMLLASRAVRQELLRIQKGFICACERCLGVDDVCALPCPACSSGFCVEEI